MEEKLRKLKILNVVVIMITFKRAFFIYLSSSLVRNLLDISFPSVVERRRKEGCANLCGEVSPLGEETIGGLVWLRFRLRRTPLSSLTRRINLVSKESFLVIKLFTSYLKEGKLLNHDSLISMIGIVFPPDF